MTSLSAKNLWTDPSSGGREGRKADEAISKKYHFFLSSLSGILLALSFPKFSLGFLAWFSLIPLLAALEKSKSLGQALGQGFVTGLVFFAISLHWMTHVTGFGWFFLVCLEAFFLMFFSWLVWTTRNQDRPWLKNLTIALAWTATEVLRAEFPVFGLGWNLAAYSQSDYLWILQSANLAGAYGLGFVMALVNAMLYQIMDRRPKTKDQSKFKRGLAPLGLTGLIFAALVSYGYYEVHGSVAGAKGKIRVGVVQGNIAQEVKWDAEAREKILQIYLKLTELAFFQHPDLVFWPEAAFPGYFNKDVASSRVRGLVQKYRIPLVVGAPHLEEEKDKAYNSAYLLSAEGEIKQRYDKQYLVPFGEYVPLKFIFGWLEPLAYSLGVSDFSAGRKPTVFDLYDGEVSFSTLICFEDVFPNLARRFVDRGANFLAVITNDAWFGDSSAPYQHLQASIFRAVENGVPVVRAANTGISAFVSKQGKVLDRVQNPQGRDLSTLGEKVLEISLPHQKTGYRRGGWIFGYAAWAALVIIFLLEKFRAKRK